MKTWTHSCLVSELFAHCTFMKCAGGGLSHLTNIFQYYQDNTGAKFVILFAAQRKQQATTGHCFLCVGCHFKVFLDYSNSTLV